MACSLYFNSTSAFDRHRIGPMHGRRCLTVDEMLAKGMERNAAGFWMRCRYRLAPVTMLSKCGSGKRHK